MTGASSFLPHDHAACRARGVAAAVAACAARGLRLTPVRRRTLEILLESHAAIGAYDVLARLDSEGMGSAPPVAYRALAFLIEHGFAHRIERLNAYVACDRPGDVHAPAFLICRGCRAVCETPAGPALEAPARAAGFVIERTVVEVEGLCPSCTTASAA